MLEILTIIIVLFVTFKCGPKVAMIFFAIIDLLMVSLISLPQKDSEYRGFLIKEIECRENLDDLVQKEKDKTQEGIEESREFSKKKAEQKDILMQMLKNNDETTDYFKISKRQAQSSFWFSIVACIIGIIAICLSLYAIFEMKDMQFAIIGIAGGTITEVIAGTVLVVHNKSALQLNYYYDALHENEKILSAINLADKLGEEQTQMYMEIIKAQIKQMKFWLIQNAF